MEVSVTEVRLCVTSSKVHFSLTEGGVEEWSTSLCVRRVGFHHGLNHLMSVYDLEKAVQLSYQCFCLN